MGGENKDSPASYKAEFRSKPRNFGFLISQKGFSFLFLIQILYVIFLKISFFHLFSENFI